MLFRSRHLLANSRQISQPHPISLSLWSPTRQNSVMPMHVPFPMVDTAHSVEMRYHRLCHGSGNQTKHRPNEGPIETQNKHKYKRIWGCYPLQYSPLFRFTCLPPHCGHARLHPCALLIVQRAHDPYSLHPCVLPQT